MIQKSIAFQLLFVLVFSALSFAPASTHKYVAKDKVMSVEFPASFDVDNGNAEDDLKTVKATASYKGLTYFASFTKHEMEIEDQAEMNAVSLNGFHETTKGEITKQSDWKVKGQKGVQAVILLEDGLTQIDYRVVFKGRYQFQLVAAGAIENWDEKVTKTFFKSFKIMK